MIIKQLNPHSCKTYLIKEETGNKVLLVDPVIEHVNDYLDLLKKENYELEYVIDTHTHADHISGASSLKGRTNCEYIMHELSPAQCAGRRVKEGDSIQFGAIKIDVIETPGHTKDAISLIIENNLLTGDALFLDDGGAGRDDLPGGDPAQHWESLKKFMDLNEELIVYPAHDYQGRKPSSLKHQKETNPHLKFDNKEDFVEYLLNLKLGPAEWMKDVLKANYACARDPKAAWIPVDTPACEIKGTLAQGVNDQQVEAISAEELKAKLDAGETPLLLDVRETEELSGELGQLNNITHIAIADLTSNLSKLENHKDKTIVTICRSGHRAHTAAQILQQAGFNKVTVLEGGMIDWVSKYK